MENSKITMTLSYEDESGNISETTKDFELEVTEAVDDSDMYMIQTVMQRQAAADFRLFRS